MKRIATAAILLTASISPTFAETIEVEMLNKNDASDRMVLRQDLIRADVGDIIRFVPTVRSHNASVRDAWPDGQEPFRGRINQGVEYVVTEAGLTAVICAPHRAMGMVALIVVDDDLGNADEIIQVRIPGKGGDKSTALVEDARASLASETGEPTGKS